MSEYQYYEFRAVDKPLNDRDFKWVRGLSTRAEITRTHFVNTYEWGGFKGDPLKMLDRCFDAFVYDNNFGSRYFDVKVPSGSLNLTHAKVYGGEFASRLEKKKGGIIVCFDLDEDAGMFDEMGLGSERWMTDLLPIREELISGDLRSLYIAWLGRIQAEEFSARAVEPPVPPGLNELTAAQSALADFLLIEPSLIEIAAKASPSIKGLAPTVQQERDYISELDRSALERDFLRVLRGEGAMVRREHLRRLNGERYSSSLTNSSRRRVAEIHDAWSEVRRPRSSVNW